MALHVSLAAGTYVFAKPAAEGFGNPEALTLARSLLASVLCLALTGWAVPTPRFTRREWLEIAGLGLLVVPLNQYLFLLGLRDTVPSHAALIYAMTPAGVLLLSAAIERRRPPGAWLLGVTLALAGVALVLEPWHDEEALREVRRGDFAIFLGLIIWVVYTVWVRRLTRTSDPRTVTVWTLVLGTLFLVPFAIGPLVAIDFAAVSPGAWGGVLWLGVITSTVMMLLWNGMLRRLEPLQVAICANAQPAATALLAALLSWAGLLTGEQRLGPAYWAGTALVLAGVVIVQRRAGLAPGPAR
jgi:drug/metabolite transporter (DMT)-like permease